MHKKKKNVNSTYLTKIKYYELISEVKQLKLKPRGHKLLKKYDVITVSNVEKLIVPVREGNDFKYYVFNEELFNIINDTHLTIGHNERNRMEYELNKKYKNITRESIMLYLNLYNSCQKKGSTAKKVLVVKPIISNDLNSKFQIDFIDM